MSISSHSKVRGYLEHLPNPPQWRTDFSIANKIHCYFHIDFVALAECVWDTNGKIQNIPQTFQCMLSFGFRSLTKDKCKQVKMWWYLKQPFCFCTYNTFIQTHCMRFMDDFCPNVEYAACIKWNLKWNRKKRRQKTNKQKKQFNRLFFLSATKKNANLILFSFSFGIRN